MGVVEWVLHREGENLAVLAEDVAADVLAGDEFLNDKAGWVDVGRAEDEVELGCVMDERDADAAFADAWLEE